jgi:hypothetical protein
LLYAFWPQFLFTGSVLTNDLAVTAFSAGVLALMTSLVTGGLRAGRALALALLFGAAVLSKLNALALLPVVAVATSLSLKPWLHQARWRSPWPWVTLLALLGVMVGALAVLGQLPYVTEQILHVDVLRRFFVRLSGSENNLSLVLEALWLAFPSFFASFGWGKVTLPPWLYQLWAAGFVLGALGLAVGAARRWRGQASGPDIRLLLLLGLLPLSVLAAALALVVAYQLGDLAPGRYLLPGLPAVCLLLVEGYRNLLPQRAQRYAWRALGLGAVLLGWAIPLAILIPTYAYPQPLQRPIDVPVTYAFGESIELIGYQTLEAVRPGQTTRVHVCWQAAAPVPENYTVLLEVIGPDGQTYGQLATYPGRGNFATRFWTPGVPFCDRYDVAIDPTLPAPAQAWLHLALLRGARPADLGDSRLPVIEPDGRRAELDAAVLPLRVAADGRPAAPEQPLDYRFGDALRLRGYSLALEPATRSLQVTFQWQALRALDEDYAVFVHLRDSPVSAYAQSDSAPRAGWYPTHLWQAGEVVDDTHWLVLPAGNAPPLSLYVGVVQAGPGVRLPAVDGAGERLLNDELILLSDWAITPSWALPASLRPPLEAGQ